MAVDWGACEDKLHKASVAAIKRLARNQSDQSICFFAFDSEPRYGYVLIAFDTLENNIRSAKSSEQFAIEGRLKMLSGADAWQTAKYFLSSPVLMPFNTNPGDFAFQGYSKVKFPEWQELAEKGGYPVGEDWHDDYLESSARLVFWRVAERLVAEQAFRDLRISSPFMIGYAIHDQGEVILRLLNWPG
jgi:hypothetical protein